MKKLLFSLLLLILAVGLAACSDDDATSKDKTKEAKVSDTKTGKKEAKKEEGVIATQLYATKWSDDWKGLKTKITEVSIIKMEASAMETMMMEGEGIIAIKFELENNSDQDDFNTYPDQATLLVDGQQVDASMFGSDSVGGELLKSAKKEGVVNFEIPKLEDVKAIKKIRLKWTSSVDTDDYSDENIKEFDVTIDLK